MQATVAPAKWIRGEIFAPPDKSISHRSVILNGIAQGKSNIKRFLFADDCISTVVAMQALGVEIKENDDGVTVLGRGLNGLQEPDRVLNLGNSGTTARLLSGVLAGRDIFTGVTGDSSLRSRPMDRVVFPLRDMGARIEGRNGGRCLPLAFLGGTTLAGTIHEVKVASAQVKSALLLAGLRAEDGPTTVIQPAKSRDHTERMLDSMGAILCTEDQSVKVYPGELRALDVTVPGDVSAAMFWLVAAVIHPNAEITIKNVGINPTRAAALDVLRQMGGEVSIENSRESAGEPIADIYAKSSRLKSAKIGGNVIPRLIDEIPVLAVAAAAAEGETIFSDAAELRTKETDRIAATVSWLRRAGITCEERTNGLTVQGRGTIKGGSYSSNNDHRMVMSIAVAGASAESPVTIDNAETASISYPDFWKDASALGISVS